MLGGESLTDDASIRDYNGGIGCHVASVLEETLLLLKDMVELRGLRRNEVFFQTKRFLGMVSTYLFTVFSCFLFDITLIIFFFKGCSKYFQNEGDAPLCLPAVG